jgi:hypothetical protein
MQKHELSELSQRLAQLADALGGKAPSAAGLLVWGDALAECERIDVVAVLTDWPKSHAKMPLPAEVLKLARESATGRRERAASAEQTAERDAAKALQKPGHWKPEAGGMTPAYAEFKRSLDELKRRTKPTPKAWAYRLKDIEEVGVNLPPVAKENWRAALKENLRISPETEDQIEARLEREAIQAEASA